MTEEKFTELKSLLGTKEYPGNICVFEGSVPVLLSVPHAVPHLRNGVEKKGEINTDVLGFILNERTGCHVFVNAGVEGDPNNDLSNSYKEELLKYVEGHGIALVIDLHGASADRDFDIELGTAGGRNVLDFEESVEAFVSLATLSGYRTSVDVFFPADGINRVSSFISSKASVPAIQMEINRMLRDDMDSVCRLSDMLSRYIKGVVALIAMPNKDEWRLLWTVKADVFMPRNLMLLPESMKVTFAYNDNVTVVMGGVTAELVVKGHSAAEGCVCMTGQMLQRCNCQEGHVLINRVNPYASHSVLKPQAEDIDNVYALLSEDLYEKYKGFEMLEVLNPIDNLRSYFKIKVYEGNVNGRTNAVWLNYYQRNLLGIEMPRELSHDFFVSFISKMDPEDREFFLKQYAYDDSEGVHVLVYGNVDSAMRLRSIWNSFYGGVRFKGVSLPSGEVNQGPLMERLIRKKTMQLRAARCADNNEIIDAVFITKSNSIILGVSELDYVWISYAGKSIRVKVIIVEKDEYQKIMKANGLKSDEELDMLICIPSKLRLGLGIYEPGTSVMIERSVKDLFAKNAFAQMVTILGLFMAIASVPGLGYLAKIVIFAVLGPAVIYSVLAGERNKI